jgi:hypothetical protein
MEDCKSKILAYMKEQYLKSNWPFFGLNDLIMLFGEHTRSALNKLHREGIIEKRDSINQKLIEYHG